MILGFRDRETEQLWRGEFVRRFEGIRRQALMRLGRLEAATSLGDLVGLSGNRLEALKGNRAGGGGVSGSMINGGSASSGLKALRDPPALKLWSIISEARMP